MSETLQPNELQHIRFPCPLLSPRVCSNSCPLGWWCHLIILSSVVPFSSWSQSFPTSRFFPMSWLFASGGQTIRASASALVLPMIYLWKPCMRILMLSLIFICTFTCICILLLLILSLIFVSIKESIKILIHGFHK